MGALYAQTSQTNIKAGDPAIPIPGLSLTLPEGVGDVALVILNVPNSYATAKLRGARFDISIDGKKSPVYAAYNYSSNVDNPALESTTLVVGVPLTLKPQAIVAWAQGCIIVSPATLSAIV